VARTRAQRRVQSIFIGLAVLTTLLVLLFAHDINTSAHQATSPRRSENASFAKLANSLILKQNNLDTRLTYLLEHGSNLTRPVFAARLEQLALELEQWQTDVQLLKKPVLAHHINTEFALITESRIDDLSSIISSVSSDLQLPGITVTLPVGSTPSLSELSSTWNLERRGLVKEPGQFHLFAFTNHVASLSASSGAALAGSPSLKVTRGIAIAAVSVNPAPLPAAQGQLLLAPVTRINVGVSVLNASYVDQPVTLKITYQPKNGRGKYQVRTMNVTIGPDRAYGFIAKGLNTLPGQRATLTFAVTGAPGAAGMTRTKSYLVTLSPSGNNS